MHRCEIVYLSYDNVNITKFYVYGPTAAEYKQRFPINSMHLLHGKLIEVHDVQAGYEEKDRAGRRHSQEERPTRFFFNPELSRERVSGGAGANPFEAHQRGRGAGGDGQADT